MSDSIGWDGDSVNLGLAAWQNDEIKKFIAARKNYNPSFANGPLLPGDPTIQALALRKQQHEQIFDYYALLDGAFGAKIDDVQSVSSLQDDTEGTAGDLGSSWSGGKY